MRSWLGGAFALVLAATAAHAQNKEVTIVHQDMVVPLRALIDSNKLQEATG